MIMTTNDSAVAAAMSGFGLTQLLAYQVADQLRDGRLEAILTEFESAVLPSICCMAKAGMPRRRRALFLTGD